MKFNILWKWFDFWVGAYWDAGHRTLYVCPLPTLVLRFEFRGPKDESKHRIDRRVGAAVVKDGSLTPIPGYTRMEQWIALLKKQSKPSNNSETAK